MAHLRKKGGERKDKKVARMREDLEERKASADKPDFGNDQEDIQRFKPGSAGDRSVDPSAEYRRH